MAFTRKIYPSTYKSLLHFNYPYVDETPLINRGLRDEIASRGGTPSCGGWVHNGSTLVGQEQTVDAVVADTPKWGWRCLQTTAAVQYAERGTQGVLRNQNSTVSYSMFIRPVGMAYQGNLILLANSVGVRLETTGKLTVFQGATVQTGATSVTLDSFEFVQLIISAGKAAVYYKEVKEAEITLSAFSGTNLRLGGARQLRQRSAWKCSAK